ncbi:uncharacterized protein UDID_06996 [Ustilago sp. UG-2017a]|nr:uncharacterized protein UDID_06996 [Ustilago sp. UG-2017a]
MSALPSATSRWADAPSQLVSSRLEQGLRVGSTPSNSIDSASLSHRWPDSLQVASADSNVARPPSPLERAESFMSSVSGVLSAATITNASSATIRKIERIDASARPVRFTKSRKEADPITPSSSVEHTSSQSTDAAEYQSSSISAGDQSYSTITTSFETTLRSPSDDARQDANKHRGATSPSHQHPVSLDPAEPRSFFSDSFSGDDSTRSFSATSSRLASLNPESLRIAPTSRRGSDQAPSDIDTSEPQTSQISHSSSCQSAISSLANAADALVQASRPTRYTTSQSSSAAKYGLDIQTRGLMPSSQPPPQQEQQLTASSLAAPRFRGCSALEVVLEARESPYIGSRASQAASTPDAGASSALTITTIPLNSEPAWGQSTSANVSSASDPAFGTMASFSFPSPSPISSSAGFTNAQPRSGQSSSLFARFPRSPASAFHSSNPSMQSSFSNANGRSLFSSRTSDAGLLHAFSTCGHAPPSSFGGFVISSTGLASALGFSSTVAYSSLNPGNRDDMLQRLLLDQARVDSQEYGTMSLEQVAEAKHDLEHIERKVQTLRAKLKVEIKIRDAAVALRRAHRRTAASAHSPTSSVSVVSPTSPGLVPLHRHSNDKFSSSFASTSSFAVRSRALSISASEAKSDEDVSIATAKVDKVANELIKWTERANSLRRRLLEHQAATLSERVVHLESDRQVMEEKLPFLTTSTSFESLAPSASASAVGINRYRDAGHRYQPSTDEPYVPRGPNDTLRHNRIESDLSAISGFSFLDASAPEKLRRLGEEVERKREMVRKLESDLTSARDAAKRREESSDRLTQQLEEQYHERSRAVEELRTLREQMNRHEESACQAQAQVVQAAIADVEQRMQRQLEQERSRDQDKEDALVNAKAEVMAGQRALADLQARLAAAQDEAKTLQLRAEAAEQTSEEHKRNAKDVQGETARQLTQESQDLASLRTELESITAAKVAATTLASDRAKAIAELEVLLKQVRSELGAEKQARMKAEEQVAATQEQVLDSRSRADQADDKLRELELAVSAERRMMAERDELFHAFERRLESAEQRLQVQDKRCARMLGKLEGREEMDDLLERIKAGAAGVAKKKTAGQDIAGLLTSLETHIGDLELELARANAQLPDTPRDSVARSDVSATPTVYYAELEASKQEVQRWKAEAERLEASLKSKTMKEEEAKVSTDEHRRLHALEVEMRALFEKNETSKRQAEEQRSQLEAEVQSLAQQNKDLEQQGLQRVKQLETKIGELESRNRELEKQLSNVSNHASNPASPATSPDTLPVRAVNTASPRSATFPLPNKGVGNLIDRFGGGLKVSSECRAEDSPAMTQAWMRSIENLRAMLPDLSAAAKGPADLNALRDAFQTCSTVPPSPTAVKSPSSARIPLGAADLQAELEATAERIRSTLAIGRTVIDLALESEVDKENRAQPQSGDKKEATVQAQADALSSQQALLTRITSLTAKVKEQADREKRLKVELAEVRGELEEARAIGRVPLSPYGLTPGNESMLGLSTSPATVGVLKFFGVPGSLGGTGSNRSMTTRLGEKPTPISAAAYTAGGAALAPPRSPSVFDGMPSPTRSNISVHSSPSIRYIPPFAAPNFGARSPQRMYPKSRSLGAEAGAGNVSLSESSTNMDASDFMSLRSSNSPNSTHLGLPRSAASLTGTSQSSSSAQRAGADPSLSSKTEPNGMIKRTITLGMDVPQLVSRVRDLERQLLNTASIRQRAERAADLETQLREANQAYTKLLDRLDAERNIDTHQKVEILNELNETQSRLQTTQAQIQRARLSSPFVSPLANTRPLPPPKD